MRKRKSKVYGCRESGTPYDGRLSRAICFTRRSYACRSFLYIVYASNCAGSSALGVSSSSWIPSSICAQKKGARDGEHAAPLISYNSGNALA